MSLWKFSKRFYHKLLSVSGLQEVKTEVLSPFTIQASLLPYQILYVNPLGIRYLHSGISMEYTSGKVVELNNASTQGLKDVVMSASSKVFIVDVVDSLFCEKTKFLCATSFVKILDEGSFYHLSGRGSLVFKVWPGISLEEDEKIMINYDALVAYDEKVKKELVKSLDLLFWYVSGPGTCAVSWNKIEDQNQKTKTTDAKNAQEVKEDSEDNKNTTILSNILDQNNIII